MIEKKYFQKIHNKTKRDYLSVMKDNKAHSMDIAKKYSKDFFDGKRKYGYGGYNYIPGWWMNFCKKVILDYKLKNDSSILDIGCGKGFLLYDFYIENSKFQLAGFDISKYAIKNSMKEIKNSLFVHDARNKFSFYKDNTFDLAISICTLHNLEIFDLVKSLNEMSRVSKKQYIIVESYRNNKELFNLQCWAKTCETFLSTTEWKWLFKEYGYKGDYEFIYFT